MLNRKSLLLSLILSLVFGSASVFASNLTERNVYGILSENFTGALQRTGYDVDNICYYNWAGGGKPESRLIEDAEGAKEGKKYFRFLCLKKGEGQAGSYSGFGYAFVTSDNSTEQSMDVSRFRYLDFWIKREQGNIEELKIGVKSAGANKVVSMSDYVSNSNDDWQHVVLDLNTLGATKSSVSMPLLVICDDLSEYTTFFIDNAVLRTDDSSADFKVTLKKVDDMYGAPENPTEISWLNYSGWQAAAQYIEIDADKYSHSWTVMLYVRHQGNGHNRSGLWAQGNNGEDYVVPMCFRVYNGYLKNVIESPVGDQSYLIGQSNAEHHNLYDRGVNPNKDPGFYPWLWMKEYNDIDFTKQSDIDEVTVWNSAKGYHAALPFFIDGDPNKPSDGFAEFTGVNKILRVYLGAGFGGAAGGIDYTATVVVDVNYE